MTREDWIHFKLLTENKFKTASLNESWGYQIQKDTQWNVGLNNEQIKKLEEHFGFKFPHDYVVMLRVLNGFKTLHISIDPDGSDFKEFERRCYKYPDDIVNTVWLIDEINENIKAAFKALNEAGFDSNDVEGFVPLYGHRALVVMKDKTKSPVISVHGDDIIVYGNSILDYWCLEFNIDFRN